MGEKSGGCRQDFFHADIGTDRGPVNIPVQMICAVDTNGKISPLRFRYETADHMIETLHIERIISRDEKNYVGIREMQYICTVQIDGYQHILEIRFQVDSQKWRIFQFLS